MCVCALCAYMCGVEAKQHYLFTIYDDDVCLELLGRAAEQFFFHQRSVHIFAVSTAAVAVACSFFLGCSSE